jgi:hypothetical protein
LLLLQRQTEQPRPYSQEVETQHHRSCRKSPQL